MNEPTTLTLDEILSLPGNRAVFDALVSSLSDGEAIAFVGAGASAGMYPLWGEFIGQLADHAVAEGKAEPREAERWKSDTVFTPQQRVNAIQRRIGEPRYRSFLKDTFEPRRGADGKRYTATHATLLRLPFAGYVTTNYDPALEFARMDLRPGSLTTGTPTWQDGDEVHRWHTGDVFRREGDCPILWLHGYWQRPNGIVLNSGEYSRAYKPGLYRRLFEGLWGQRHLVFVGFGFNDPQFTFMVGEYLRELGDANALPRHVAILGLQPGTDGRLPDPEDVRGWRDNLEADYHIRPLFYPVRGGDHSALQTVLDAIADACDCAALAPTAAPAAPTPTSVVETDSAITSRLGGADNVPLTPPDKAARPLESEIEVFISFKHLDDKGDETRDYVIARNVARFLRGQGFSAFFSPESLERIGTSDFRGAIEAALERSTILVAIGTSRENLTSRWVEHEWSSFLHDLIEGFKPRGEVFTVIEGISLGDLPRGLRQRQVFRNSDKELTRMANFIRSNLNSDKR